MTAIRGVGVSYGAISRSRGDGVLARSRYQRGFAWRATDLPENTERNSSDRQWLLLPEGAPNWAMDPDVLWSNAAEACKRCDAQEGRHFDIVWPRDMPEAAAEEAVLSIYGVFRAMGLPVQVNRHTTVASDGRPNPHLHGMIGTRVLDEKGFSARVCGDVAGWFHKAGGKQARDHVASVLNQLAALHGVDVRFDPRPNRERGLPAPEDRLPRSFIRCPDTAAAKQALLLRDAQRAHRRDHAALRAEIEELEAQRQSLIAEQDRILKAALVFLPGDGSAPDSRRLDATDFFEIVENDLFQVGAPVELGPDGIAIPVDGGSIIDTGARLLVEGAMSHAKALVLRECARLKGWRGVKVESREDSGPQIDDRAWYSNSPGNRQDQDFRVPANARVGIEALLTRLRPEWPSGDILFQLRDISDSEGQRSMANIFRRLLVIELGVAPPPTVEDVLSIVDAEIAARDDGSRWRRWILHQDLAAIMISSNAIGAVVHDKVWRPPIMKTFDLQHAP